jgi:hypothetical protein
LQEIIMFQSHLIARAALGIALVSVATFASAIQRGITSTGMAYVSGGVGYTELVELSAEKKNYSFWLTTAAKGSGAHLADVRVRIVDTRTQALVLEHTMDGPWLFAALPVGRYEVQASLEQPGRGPVQVQKQMTTIHPGDHHQMVMYFETGDAVSPENPKLP